MTRLDHELLATRDLDRGAEQLLDGWGLDSVPGGTHPSWGTSNRIVPLAPGQYLELVAASDRQKARENPFGRAVLELADPERPRAIAVCLAVPDLEAVAARLGRPLVAGRRALPDGAWVTWRSVAMEEPAGLPSR